jgi:hypothetical protein
VSHAVLTGQSEAALQPHDPPTQAWPLLLLVQSVQVPLADPHVPGFVSSDAHVVPLQHVPLQGSVEEHVVVQVFFVASFVVSHALPLRHSVLSVQPHVPPPVTGRHEVPTLLLVHTLQVLPVDPQPKLGSVPTTHAPLALQQPPLHGLVVEHAELHLPFEPHAMLAGQSLAEAQPHALPMHLSPPLRPDVQSAQEPPAAPHVLVAVSSVAQAPAVVQHVPLQACVPEHEVVH